MDKCNGYSCCIGYTFNPRAEFFKRYYLDELMLSFDGSLEDKIDYKFNFCPDCGSEIPWRNNN